MNVKGSIPALVTPFRNGKVDEKAFVALVERQIQAGTHALVPCGTTGEASTLSREEHMHVVERFTPTTGNAILGNVFTMTPWAIFLQANGNNNQSAPQLTSASQLAGIVTGQRQERVHGEAGYDITA